MDYEAEAHRRLSPYRRENRDAEIRRCHADGIPASVIAKAVGLSRQHVYDIINAGLDM